MREKTFNTAGPCDPEWHYMLPPEARLGPAAKLIEQARYFVIHAPRQSGKTTAIRAFAERLTAEGTFTALWITCERAQAAGDDVEAGVDAVLRDLAEHGRALPRELRPPELDEVREVEPLSRLYVFLRRWSQKSPKPLVLFFDEFDALLGNSLISVLRQLRSGFPERPAGFPQSIALIGLRDVRGDATSPFNIKSESLHLRDFTAEEVRCLCRRHQEATGQIFSPRALQRIHDLTHGQPWLVNALARQLVEVEVVDSQTEIDEAAVEIAKERLILRRDTHLDSLAARLQEPRVRRVLAPYLAGSIFGQDVCQDDLDYAVELGLLRFEDGNLIRTYPIYWEIIPSLLSAADLP